MPQFIISGVSGEKTWNFPDAEVFVIGRSQSCAVHLPDQNRRVSKQHAAVVRISGPPRYEYFIRDLGSRESTRVNGQHVYQRVLSDGSLIQIADYSLVFRATGGYRPAHPNVRVVSPDEPEDAAGETITSTDFRTASGADSVAQEFLEQFIREKDLGATAESLIREFATRLLKHVQADRGFVGRIISADSGEYDVLQVFGLRADDDFDITAADWLNRILNKQTIEECARSRHTLVIPIGTPDGVCGFFYLERATASFSADTIHFLRTISHVLGAAWILSESDEATNTEDQVRVWPVEMVGCSRPMEKLRNAIYIAAQAKQNTLVFGETGTGKEIIARALYNRGCSPSAPKVDLACGALPETLAASELFGKERGAFTGADRTTKGAFERAHGGAILLDDIQQLPLAIRPNLYRVLAEKEVSRVGSTSSVKVDVFVIGTVEVFPDGSHKFQTSFLERFPQRIYVPPLRERREDIPLLVFYFLDSCAARERKRTRSISHHALQMLMKYEWPGNVRELKTCIENAVRQDVEVILSSDLPAYLANSDSSIGAEQVKVADEHTRDGFVPRKLKEIVKDAIEKTLIAKAGNKTATAKILGLSEQGLRNKMKAFGIGPTYGKADK